MKKILFVTLFLSLTSSAFAQNTVCRADGMRLRQTGSQGMAKVRLAFDDIRLSDGTRVIKNIEGYVKVANIWDENNPPAESEYDVGEFRVAELTENLKYIGSRYRGFSQFKDLTSEDHYMSGNLLLEKGNKMSFKAHYIFQSGDHMGGTVDMNCMRRR